MDNERGPSMRENRGGQMDNFEEVNQMMDEGGINTS